MTGFLIASLLLVAIVLVIVLPSLWKGARRTALVLALALPIAAGGLYHLLGAPDALDPENVAIPETLDDAIGQLERKLADEPGSVEGWVLLGRSRMAQQKYVEARDAFAKAHALLPDELDLRVEYADAQMRAAGDGRFPDSAVALLESVVAAQPNHQRGLFFLGAQRLQAGKPAEAAQTWERLLPLVDAGTAKALAPQIAMAREQAGLPPMEAPTATAAGPSITVRVSLAPALASRLTPSDTLFVFARKIDGAGPPVAAKRLPAADFPIELTLSDADSLMPTAKLSAQGEVLVMARISRSGDAAAVPGDLEAEALPVSVSDGAEVSLFIDQVLP